MVFTKANKRKRFSVKKKKTSSSIQRRSTVARLPSQLYISPRDLVHRHSICMSSSQTTGAGQCSMLASLGLIQFNIGGVSSPNMSIDFGLGTFSIKAGGASALTLVSPSQQQLANLYDAYIVESVEVTIRTTTNSIDQGATLAIPVVGYAVDNDDSQNTTYDALMQYANFKSKTPTANDPIKVKFKPAVTPQLYQSAVATSYSRQFNQQVDCASPNAPHYALKLSIDGMGTAYPNGYLCAFNVEVRQHLIMLSTR